MEDVVDLLQQTEEEEKAADQKLTEVAVGIYEEAEESGQEAVQEEQVPVAKPATRRAGGR